MCDKACERWCVTKKDGACDSCVKERVWQSCVKDAQRKLNVLSWDQQSSTYCLETNKTQPRPFARSKWKTSLCYAIGSPAVSTRTCRSQWPNFGNSSSQDASNHFLGNDTWMIHSRTTKSFMKQFWGQRANVTSIVTKILNMTIEMKRRTLHQPML